MNQPDQSRWNWPPFLLYCFVFFFIAMLLGAWGLPGIGAALPGAAIGFFAARGRWFEASVHPWEHRREELSSRSKEIDGTRSHDED